MSLNSLVFLIHESLLNIRRNGLMSLAALGTVTVALTVLGGSTWTAYRTTEIAQEQPERFNVIAVFLHDNVARSQTLEVEQRIEANPLVRATHLISKEQAWAALRHREPTLTEALPGNPLMDRLDVEAASGNSVALVAAWIRDRTRFPEVLQVNDANHEVQTLLSLARVLKVIGISLALGLFMGTLFIVQNTIRLTTFARRREIRIMQLVGATPSFIRFPLILEGVFHGLVGGLLASAILIWCARQVSHFIQTLHSPLIGDVPSRLSTADVTAGLILIGALIGLLGSTLSLRRFLHQP